MQKVKTMTPLDEFFQRLADLPSPAGDNAKNFRKGTASDRKVLIIDDNATLPPIQHRLGSGHNVSTNIKCLECRWGTSPGRSNSDEEGNSRWSNRHRLKTANRIIPDTALNRPSRHPSPGRSSSRTKKNRRRRNHQQMETTMAKNDICDQPPAFMHVDDSRPSRTRSSLKPEVIDAMHELSRQKPPSLVSSRLSISGKGKSSKRSH